MNLDDYYETVIEFPQLIKSKSVKWCNIDWIFGDSQRYEANEIFEDNFAISACNLFKGKLSDNEIAGLFLLGPSDQDLSVTLNESLLSSLNFSLTPIQQRYLDFLIDSGTGDLNGVSNFKPNFNLLRESLILSWDAKAPEKIRLYNPIVQKPSFFALSPRYQTNGTGIDFNPYSQMARIGRVSLLQGQIRSVKNAGLDSALYKLGGVRPFLLIFANSLNYKKGTIAAAAQLQANSLFVLLSSTHLNSTFANDFLRLSGHQMTKQVLASGSAPPELLRTMAGFCCRGALFDPDSNELIKHNDAVITDVNILKSLLLDCTIWSRHPESWKLQFTIFNSLVDERHKYREFNLRTLIEAEAVLRLLETLQIALAERPELEISAVVADTMIELIRALIGYPPDTKIISRVFDFCCAIHPPAEAYVTNTRKKFYFYPQFEKSNNTKSMQAKMERSQSLDVLEVPSPKTSNSAPKRIRTLFMVTK